MKIYCEYCEKELSEEKGEVAHGCLDCTMNIVVDKYEHVKQKLTQQETIIKRLTEALESIADCAPSGSGALILRDRARKTLQEIKEMK